MGRFGLRSLLNIVVILFLSSAVVYSQSSSDNVWVWDDFSGGLDVKTASTKLDKRHGDICENIRFNEDRTSIFKRQDILLGGTADSSEPITGMHRLYLSNGTKKIVVTHGDEVEVRDDSDNTFDAILDLASGGYKWQFLTWHDLLIGMDGYNFPIKYDGSSASATYLGTCLATDAGSGAGPNGTYTYKVTFYTASYEVGFNTASNSITVSDSDIDLTQIPIGPTTYLGEDTVGRKVYRTLDSGSTYYLLSNGTIANNTATTLTDSDADGAVGSEISTDLDEAPPKGRLCLVHQDRLWIANNPTYPSRVYYSDLGNHDYFPVDNYYDIRQNDGDGVTLLKDFQGILTVGKNNSIQKLYTNVDDISWEVSDPFNFVGCHAMYSVADSIYGTIYVSKDGIYVFNGQYSKLLSDKVSPIIEDISEANFSNAWGIVHKSKYYLAYCSEDAGTNYNNRLLVYEIPTDTYSIDLLDINAMCRFGSGTDSDVLYYGSSLSGAIYSSTEESYDIIHNRHSDFDDGTWDDARYLPEGVGGDPNSPIIEIANITNIDSLTGTIDNLTGIIDREDTSGTYTSPSIKTNMDSLDKVYWNEIIPPTGGSVTVAIRTDDDDASWGSWSAEYSTAAGSDISAITANQYLQYRITITATDIDYSPILYRNDNYVLRITYGIEGASSETSVPIRWRSGWTDFGFSGRDKVLRRIECYYTGSAGDLELTFENYRGDEDSFTIDLAEYPTYYANSFSGGGFPGDLVRLTIKNDDLNSLVIDKIIVVYDIRPVD